MNKGYTLGDEGYLAQLAEKQGVNKTWTLVYIRSGRGMYLLDGDLRALNEGDLLLLSPKLSFSFRTKDLGDEYNINLTAVVLRFDSTWLDAVLAAFPVARDLVLRVREVADSYMIKGPKWIKLSSLLDEMLTCRGCDQPIKVFSILELISNLEDMKLLARHAAVDINDLSYRRQCIDRYIECNYCNKISLEDISGYVGMSRTYFCNFFRSHYGEGFSDYINRLRVEKASVLLATTEKSLEQIAQECGFKTVQYFTRAFGKFRQVTPGAFRRVAQ